MTSNIVVNFTRNLVFVTAVCSAISVVNAAEIYEPSATGSSWTGAYVGAFVGAGGVVNNVEIPGLGAGNLNGLGGEGVLGGFMAGYNYQVSPNFVVGLQGDVGWSNMDIELNIPGIPLTASAGPGFLASLSLRAGWLSSENTMWYVLGGYSHAEFEASLVTPGPVVSVKQTYNGFHLGTGMETKISENMTARVEYRYTQFAGEDWGTAGFLNIEPSSHAGTIALAYNWYNPNASSAYQDYSSTADADWTGLYLGAYVGAGAMVSNIELPGLGAGNFDGLGGEGILGGLLVGYNHMTSSNFVVGIQGDIGLSGLDAELSIPALGVSASAGPDLTASVSLRAGWLTSPDTMWYVLGGYSHAKFEASLTTPGPVGSVKQTYNGFHVGTGIETMLTSNVSARVEYRYTQYAGEDWGTAGFLNIEPSSHTGIIALVWNR